MLQPKDKYGKMMREFGLVIFEEEVVKAIETFNATKNTLEENNQKSIQAEIELLNKDIQPYIEKGLSEKQAYLLLGIDKKERNEKKQDIKQKYYKEKTEKINEIKMDLRKVFWEQPAFSKVKEEIEWFEDDYSFLKTFAEKVAAFFEEMEKSKKAPEPKTDEDENEKPDELLWYHFELLFDALYFAFEREMTKSRLTKALIHSDVINELMGVNDELYEDLVAITERAYKEAKDEKDEYHREKNWFVVHVCDVN